MRTTGLPIGRSQIDRRSFLVGGMGMAGVVVLGACSSGPGAGPPEGPTARIEVLRLAGGDVGFPSPFAYSRGGGYIQASMIYDTLMWKDSTGAFLPWLAESFAKSADGHSYIFTLRPGIRWHDGMPLTARDVAFTFDYFRKQTISPQVIVQPLPEIAEVTALDDRRVEFRLSTTLAPFFEFGGVGSVLIVPSTSGRPYPRPVWPPTQPSWSALGPTGCSPTRRAKAPTSTPPTMTTSWVSRTCAAWSTSRCPTR